MAITPVEDLLTSENTDVPTAGTAVQVFSSASSTRRAIAITHSTVGSAKMFAHYDSAVSSTNYLWVLSQSEPTVITVPPSGKLYVVSDTNTQKCAALELK